MGPPAATPTLGRCAIGPRQHHRERDDKSRKHAECHEATCHAHVWGPLTRAIVQLLHARRGVFPLPGAGHGLQTGAWRSLGSRSCAETRLISTLLITHPACLEHDPGREHPEQPARLRAVLDALEAPRFAPLARVSAPQAAEAQIARVHTQPHIDRVFHAVPRAGVTRLDPDTVMSPVSGEAALRAAGAVVHAVEEVVAGRARNAFCAVRPPGHHAEPAIPDGFLSVQTTSLSGPPTRASRSA